MTIEMSIMESTHGDWSDGDTGTYRSESIPMAEWFAKCLEFLRDFSWIYDYKVTKFFVEQPWRNIPEQWRNCLLDLSFEELNLLPFGKIKDEWPDTFSTFVQNALEMSMPRGNYSVTPVEIPCELKKGMNPKKQHEVALMATILHQLMEEASVSVVVDVGAGLGYLGQVLQQQYGYKVISLECDDSRSHGAQRRNIRLNQESDKFVSLTFNLQDNAEVMNQFEEHITGIVRQGHLDFGPKTLAVSAEGQRVSPVEVKVCVTGLHCCGDLTPTMMKYFTKLDCVTLLAGVSCCYHRMAVGSGEHHQLKRANFPMSRTCQAALREVCSANQLWTLGTPAFRLAAQETRARWINQTDADHMYHQRNVAFRGILGLFCHEENLTLNRICRKLALKKNCETFEDYVGAVFDRTNLTSVEQEVAVSVEVWKEKLQKTYRQCEEFFAYIEPLTCLQVLLQPVLENLIHQDRLRYLQEQGFQAYILPVFDEFISPRNLVLVARKSAKTVSKDSCGTCGKTVPRDSCGAFGKSLSSGSRVTCGKTLSCETCVTCGKSEGGETSLTCGKTESIQTCVSCGKTESSQTCASCGKTESSQNCVTCGKTESSQTCVTCEKTESSQTCVTCGKTESSQTCASCGKTVSSIAFVKSGKALTKSTCMKSGKLECSDACMCRCVTSGKTVSNYTSIT